MIAASTYGYPYRRFPTAPDHRCLTTPFVGGMTRVDVRPDESGCDVKWNNTVRSAALPKLSIADGMIATVTRHNPLGDQFGTTPADKYSYAAVDASTGALPDRTVHRRDDGRSQTAGTTAPGGAIYQGTLTGIQRICRWAESPGAQAVPNP